MNTVDFSWGKSWKKHGKNHGKIMESGGLTQLGSDSLEPFDQMALDTHLEEKSNLHIRESKP